MRKGWKRKEEIEESRKEVQDVNLLRETLLKTKSELRVARRSSSVARSKIDFARKITDL